jgi:dUTP pyrophosphatase
MKRFFEIISKYAELPKEGRPILPKRQTKNSAGYDFYALEDVVIPAHEERNLNTGIKACMPADEHLELFIRSSYGIKYGLMLNNCVGIIDADYYNNPDNEGEILARIRNCSDETMLIHKGDRFCQGIFVKHYLTDNDDADGERIGGVGSTTK